MLTDVRLVLPNRPGAMIRACAALAEAGINIEAICGDLRPGETWGYLHVLVEDGTIARTALEEAGFEVTSAHDVELLDIEDRPGALVEAFRAYAHQGKNIETVYMAKQRIVVGTEETRKPVAGVRVEDARYPSG